VWSLLSEELTWISSAGAEQGEMIWLFGLGADPAVLFLALPKRRPQVILDMMSACI
jgi:hypothetical protein